MSKLAPSPHRKAMRLQYKTQGQREKNKLRKAIRHQKRFPEDQSPQKKRKVED